LRPFKVPFTFELRLNRCTFHVTYVRRLSRLFMKLR
jgi:hypothetical protein